MPDAVNSLPPDLLRADLNLLGLGFSLATAPPALLTASSLPQVGLSAVDSRVYELAQAGVEVTMGEAPFDSAAILAVQWTGAEDQDATWDQLRRITEKGGTAGARLGAMFAADATPIAMTVAKIQSGAGTIRGRIAYDDGSVPANPQVIAYSPVFREWGGPSIRAQIDHHRQDDDGAPEAGRDGAHPDHPRNQR